MGRQPRLVLLLLLAIGAIQLTVTSTPHSLNILHKEITDNDLDSYEEVHTSSSGIKISTPKVKELPPSVTTLANSIQKTASSTTNKPLTDEILKDLIEASKHNEALADDLRVNKLLPDPVKSVTNSSSTNKSEESYDEDEDDYNYDYDDEYSYDDTTSTESAKKTLVYVTGKPTSITVNKPTKKDTNKIDKQLKPIKGLEKTIPKDEALIADEISNKKDDDNSMNNNTDAVDNADDDDYDDDDDEDDEDNLTEEEVVFNENVPCPRDCVCTRNINSYLVATCSRLDPGKQKFGSDITDLIVTDVGPKYPILLGPDFFVKIGLKHVSTIKIANCTIEYLHQAAFHGLKELYSVNLTNVGLAIINPDTFVNNKKLRMLTITGNDLSIMSSVHYLLKSERLEELDLSRNNLIELNPNAFSQLPRIVYINLSQNNLVKIPAKVFDKLKTIEELDLSFNMLETLPTNIFNRTSLAILRLKQNKISGDLHFGTPELQQLDLSFNAIQQVHHGMFDKMVGLTNLILKGNGITKIQPDSFLTLKNLRNIDLSINELDQLSSLLFYKNSELDVIRLNDNPKLSQLPTDGFKSYNGYFTVYYLDISSCAIGALGHKTFSTMPHLASLKLSWNNINNLERDTFASLKNLNDLDLSNNLIVKMNDLMFMNNNEMTKLNLAGNPIRKLSVRLFLPLNKLRELDVSECELHSLLADTHYGIGSDYKFYETLRSFNASANHIKKLSTSDIKLFKNLRTLDVSRNPLKCNEEFQDFISYVSVSTNIVPNKVPALANLEEDTGFIEFQPHAGWAVLAREVCKHHDEHISKDSKLDKRVESVEEDLDEDTLDLLNIMENSKLKKMQTILKDSRRSSVVIAHNDGLGDDLNDENELDNAGEDKDDDDEEENESSYDEDEDIDDDEEEDDYDSFDKKKAEKVDLPKFGDKIDELEKDARDKFLLNKFMLNGDESDSSNEDTEEIIIERGRIYYSGYKFLIPVTIIVTCVIVMLLAVAKIVSMVMRKRGERYRMALLASSNNSIVYQKLSEEIKPTVVKESKQPKVHRYSPINQV